MKHLYIFTGCNYQIEKKKGNNASIKLLFLFKSNVEV